MALIVKWTKQSKISFDRIITYLESNFGDDTAKSFVQKSYNIIEIIKYFPQSGSLEIESKNIRGFLITKHNRLFYRTNADELILLNFYDTRKAHSSRKY